MNKLNDEEKRAWFIVVVAIIYVILLAVYYDKLVAAMSSGNTWTGLFIYYLVANPGYMLILYFMILTINHGRQVQSFISGVLLVLIVDIVNFPRLSLNPSELISAGAQSNSDVIWIKLIMSKGLSYTTSWWVYYVGIPILIILLIALVLGAIHFHKKLNDMGRV